MGVITGRSLKMDVPLLSWILMGLSFIGICQGLIKNVKRDVFVTCDSAPTKCTYKLSIGSKQTANIKKSKIYCDVGGSTTVAVLIEPPPQLPVMRLQLRRGPQDTVYLREEDPVYYPTLTQLGRTGLCVSLMVITTSVPLRWMRMVWPWLFITAQWMAPVHSMDIPPPPRGLSRAASPSTVNNASFLSRVVV